MGNSISSSKAADLANERAYIQSLGDRFPLGDAELRKYVWCYQQLAKGSDGSVLTSLAAWSVVYGGYNPYGKNQNETVTSIDPIPSVQTLRGAMVITLEHILPSGLEESIIKQVFGLNPMKLNQTLHNPLPNNYSSMPKEEIEAWQSSYYSISLSVNKEVNNYALEEFLECISISGGRRGSRALLTKLFNLSCRYGSSMVNAIDVIFNAYCLALASSYLKNVAIHTKNLDWKCFVPQETDEDTKSMVDSLISSAKKQRQSFGGGFSANFDHSHLSTSSTNCNQEGSISLNEFLEWAETTAPMISSALPTFLHVLLSYYTPTNTDKELQFPPGVTPLWIPSLTVETKASVIGPAPSSFVDPSTSLFDLFSISCTSFQLAAGRWHQLFSSETNGLSCNRLMHSILGYAGPTLILIRAKGGRGTFGAYTYTPWSQESGSFYGNSDSFLFRLGSDPFAVYRPKCSGRSMGINVDGFGRNSTSKNEKDETRNFQYFNPEARSKGYDGLAHGIGFGGTCEQPRLYIDEMLDMSYAKSQDLTFEDGPLLSGSVDSNGDFEVEAIEAWGVGSTQLIEDALFARECQRDEAAKRIRQAMKGAKGQFLEDFQSGLAGNKLFQHRDQIRGRDGDCEID